MSLSILSASSNSSRDAKNTLGLMVVVSLGLGAGSLLLNFLLFCSFLSLANKPAPSLVQMEAGKTITTAPLDSKERTPAVIQSFVQNNLMMLMSASSRLPQVDIKVQPALDPGFNVQTEKGQLKIPTVAALASRALSPDFSSEFLKLLALRTPQEIFRGDGQRVLVFQDISVPEKIGEGKWKVIVVAALVTSTANGDTTEVFNKEVFVQAVTPALATNLSNDLERAISQVRGNGLEIYAMRNYINPNL